MTRTLNAVKKKTDAETFPGQETWGGVEIGRGEACDVFIHCGESFSNVPVEIPVHVRRAIKPGPTVFVTAALHGDEINGTGAVRQLIQEDIDLLAGTLVLVPVLNIPGFERHSRYMPDRRDLNRAFPGSATGSLTGRMARRIFDEIPARCDYGIDIHTAATRRTNYPNIRGDLKDPEVRRIAEAFGCEIIMNGAGPKGAFRREACRVGCTTIIMEGGEVSKVEPSVVEASLRGIHNVLRELKMLAGDCEAPDYQLVVEKSKWMRAEHGGFLHFHVSPGDIVSKGQPLATNATLLGREQNAIHAPFDGVVIGMTTLPAISPGDPICNLGLLPRGTKPAAFRRQRRSEDGLELRLVEELGSNVMVVDHEDS